MCRVDTDLKNSNEGKAICKVNIYIVELMYSQCRKVCVSLTLVTSSLSQVAKDLQDGVKLIFSLWMVALRPQV